MNPQSDCVELHDAIVLWAFTPEIGPGAVVFAAADALADGMDSPSLRELAGLSPRELEWIVRPIVQATVEELGLSVPEVGTDTLEVAAAEAMSRRLLDGRLTARDFALWAHRTIGHAGAERLQPLVLLDDFYDDVLSAGLDTSELEATAVRQAMSLLAGEPLPAPNGPAPAEPESLIVGPRGWFRNLSGRVRGR